MLSPKKMKYRKRMRGRLKGKPTGGTELNFGDFGLQATECGYINARQIEAARIAMTRKIKRSGKTWIHFFLIIRSPRNPPKSGWVRVRAPRMPGLLQFARVGSSMKWRVYPVSLLKRRSALPLISFP